jgi:hypothetical protein
MLLPRETNTRVKLVGEAFRDSRSARISNWKIKLFPTPPMPLSGQTKLSLCERILTNHSYEDVFGCHVDQCNFV